MLPTVVEVSQSWQFYEETAPEKLTKLSQKQLEFYFNYFSEVRLELHGRDQKFTDAAQRRVELLEKEISRRYGDTRDRKTRLLAWIAIGVSALSALGSIVQCTAARN